MKHLALILAILVFSTSLKAGAFVHGLIGAVEGTVITTSCCSKSEGDDRKTCEEDNSNKQKDDCCSGANCHCTCCLHLMCFQNFMLTSLSHSTLSEEKCNNGQLFSKGFLTSIFHPPTRK